MATRELKRSQWKDYFDSVSQRIGSERVEVEVAGTTLGAQIEVEWIALNGLSYDPKDDVFEVVTDEIDHLIHHPQAIYIDDSIEGLHSVEVIDADGNKQIVMLKVPLKLPPPRH